MGVNLAETEDTNKKIIMLSTTPINSENLDIEKL